MNPNKVSGLTMKYIYNDMNKDHEGKPQKFKMYSTISGVDVFKCETQSIKLEDE